MGRAAKEESAKNSLLDLPALAYKGRRAGGSKRVLGQGLSGSREKEPPAPCCSAWILLSQGRARSLPSSRKLSTHCSTAAVCSRRASGMLSGANSIFMSPFGRGSRRPGRLEPRCAATPAPGTRRRWRPGSGRGLKYALGGRARPGGGWGCQSRAPGPERLGRIRWRERAALGTRDSERGQLVAQQRGLLPPCPGPGVSTGI